MHAMSKKPTWTRIEISLGDIDLYEYNPRTSSQKQAVSIAHSEEVFGQPLPFLVSPTYKSEKGQGRVMLYDGHQRYHSWLDKYGPDMIVGASQCSRALNDEEIRELIVTLHAGATGAWNWDALANWDANKMIKWGFDKETMKQWRSDTSSLKFVFESALLDQIPTEAPPPYTRRPNKATHRKVEGYAGRYIPYRPASYYVRRFHKQARRRDPPAGG